MLTKLGIPAGISNNKSEYAEEGRWVDCDLVRFKDGKPQKLSLIHISEPTRPY